ncbi:MAG: hypothetical protein WC326_01960 [Candidatus Delongbacteria bacterium]
MNGIGFFVLVMILLAINGAVGFWHTRRDNRTTQLIYRADPGVRGWLGIALTLTGTVVGGGMFLAVGQIGFEAGLVGYLVGVIYLFGLALLARFVRHIRKLMFDRKAHTLIELVACNYSRPVAVQFAVINCLMYVFLLAGQFVGMFVFAKYVAATIGVEWIPWVLVTVAAGMMLCYPVWGGLRKDVITDYFQVTIVGLVGGVLLIGLLQTGFFSEGIKNLPLSKLDGTGYGFVFLIGIVLFLGPLFLVRMDVWQRIWTAKSDRDAVIGLVLAGVLSLLFYVLFTSIGMAAFLKGSITAENATLGWVFETFSDPWMLAFISGGFFFAVLSSADTFINNASVFLSWVVSGGNWTKAENNQTLDKALVKKTRIIALVLTVSALGLAFLIPNFVDLFVGAFSLLLIFLPMIAGLLVEEWRSSAAAISSGLSGVIVFLVLFFTWNPTQAFAPAVVLAIVIHAVVARFSASRKVSA